MKKISLTAKRFVFKAHHPTALCASLALLSTLIMREPIAAPQKPVFPRLEPSQSVVLQAPQAAVQAVVARAKRPATAKRRAIRPSIDWAFVQSELNADSPIEATVTNGWVAQADPLISALNEAALEPQDFSRRETSEAQVDVEFAVGLSFPTEQVYREVAGIYEQNTFSEIRESFAKLQNPEFYEWKEKPAPTLVRRPKTRSKIAAVKAPQPSAPPIDPATVWVAKTPADLSSIKPNDPVFEVKPPSQPSAPSSLSAQSYGPALASITEIPLPRSRDLATGEPVTTQSLDSQIATSTQRALQAAFEDTPFESDLFGRLYLENSVRNWLEKEKAHIELHLQPVGSRDPQGTRYLSYHYPATDFREPGQMLKGRYQLIASVYRPQDVDAPYAEAVYPTEVNAHTARQHLKFSIRKSDLKPVSNSDQNGRRKSKVFLSFFEGAAADYREPHPIPGVEVRVVGYEKEFGTLVSNAEGNLIIPALPGPFDYVIEARAKGYFRTFKNIQVNHSDFSMPVYMVSKEKTQTMARALVGVRQIDETSVLMGRVFDPETRNPLEGERVDLIDHEESRGAYTSFFGELHRTGPTGFFSFFNVAAAFRYLARPENTKRAFRLPVRKSSAYYVELGRDGRHTLRGRLTDPNLGGGLGNVEGAIVRLVGDPEFSTVSGSDGQFEIPGIDFPAGALALEVEVPRSKGHGPGYRLSWHTIAWNPRQSSQVQDLFLVQDHFVEASLGTAPSSSSGIYAQTGNVIGGAHNTLLAQSPNCLQTELWSVDSGQRVDAIHGPFPFVGDSLYGQSLCLIKGSPGFTYRNLPPGEYSLKWLNHSGVALGARTIHVGMGRDSITVN